MEAKLCLVLMLFILGSLTVQGGIPRNPRKNPLAAFARSQFRECFFLIYCSTSLLTAWLDIASDQLKHGNMNCIWLWIKYDYWFVRAIVTSMANKRTTFFCLQNVKHRADTVIFFLPAHPAIIAVSAIVRTVRTVRFLFAAAQNNEDRYKFMEISI